MNLEGNRKLRLSSSSINLAWTCRLFLNELEAYVLAVEGDKTTMKLVNALDSFGDSVWNFTSM